MTTLADLAGMSEQALQQVRAIRQDMKEINDALVRLCVLVDDLQRILSEANRNASTDS